MAASTTIEWTDMTWNPVTGCTKTSAGCANCYAERMAARLKAMGNPRYTDGFEPTCHEDILEIPLGWRSPRRIFVNSMGDLFHEKIPDGFIRRAFDIMNRCPQHNFQVLTKRSERLFSLGPSLYWTPNIWAGVTVENAETVFRIDHLSVIPAKVRFLSCEPLLGPLPSLPLDHVDWVIVGGESGPGARPMKAEWATSIRDQCLAYRIPFFFKQWGGVRKKKAGRALDGKIHDEMPAFSPAS